MVIAHFIKGVIEAYKEDVGKFFGGFLIFLFTVPFLWPWYGGLIALALIFDAFIIFCIVVFVWPFRLISSIPAACEKSYQAARARAMDRERKSNAAKALAWKKDYDAKAPEREKQAQEEALAKLKAARKRLVDELNAEVAAARQIQDQSLMYEAIGEAEIRFREKWGKV
jgi:hypothetical protein